MAIVQAARFAQFYRRLASLKEAFVPSLEETILPTLELSNPLTKDIARHRGEHWVGMNTTVTALANNFSGVWIQAQKGMMFVPTLVFIIPGQATTSVTVGWSIPQAPITDVFTNLDDRGFAPNFVVPNSIRASTRWGSLQSTVTSIADVIGIFNANVGSGLSIQLVDPPIVMTRSDIQLGFMLNTVNVQGIFSIWGYERAFEQQEIA